MDKYDKLLFKILNEKHPKDGEIAHLVFKRVLLIERRRKLLATIFLIFLSYPLLYFYIFGLPLVFFTRFYAYISSMLTLVNHELTTYLLTLPSILLFLLTLLIYVFTRVMKLKRINLRII